MLYPVFLNVITGILLTILAYFCFRMSKTPGQIALSFTPVFYAIQEFLEAGVWSTYSPGGTNGHTLYGLVYFFLFWELIFPPIWVSLVSTYFEKHPLRKKVMYFCLIAGISASLFYIWHLATQNIQIYILKNKLHYQLGLSLQSKQISMILFSIAGIAPLFISSTPYMWALAILAIIEYTLDNFIFLPEYFTVWRIFILINSAVVFAMIKKQNIDAQRLSKKS